MSLQPIHPQEAVALYLDSIKQEKAKSTVYSHSSRLGHFTEFCEETDIENMNNVSGRQLHEYKIWRRNKEDPKAGKTPNKITLKSQLDTLTVFLRFCASVDAVPGELPSKVLKPSLSDEDDDRDEKLDAEVADTILTHLEKYRYASRDHVTLLLAFECLLRRGTIRAIDKTDFDAEENSIQINHRPDTGTPLKNKQSAERFIALKPRVSNVIIDYIQDVRHNITDKHNREPLITTKHGRPHIESLQTSAYSVTRPCVATGKCPHQRDPDDCEAAQRRGDASKCPSSVGPHAVRRGGVTHNLIEGLPEKITSDRADCSLEVLQKHYDKRSEREKMEQRREFLSDI